MKLSKMQLIDMIRKSDSQLQDVLKRIKALLQDIGEELYWNENQMKELESLTLFVNLNNDINKRSQEINKNLKPKHRAN